MLRFIKSIIVNVFSLFIASVIVFALLYFLLFSFAYSFRGAPVVVKDKSILIVDLGSTINDSPRPFSINDIVSYYEEDGGPHLLKAVRSIRHAAKDPAISGILIRGHFNDILRSTSLANLLELRQALEVFKSSKKPIHAYLEGATGADYALSSVADSITLNPLGVISLKGLAFESPFFGDAFGKYGIGIQSIQKGKFKSAIEPFTQNYMSEDSRTQWQAFLEDTWGHLLAVIAQSRNTKVANLQTLANETALLSDNEALEAKLIDQVGYLSDTLRLFKPIAAYDTKTRSFNQITLAQYAHNLEDKLQGPTTSKEVAILYAQGTIIDGKSHLNQMGSETIVNRLRQLHAQDSVKAIVIRVDSGGGTATASENILQAIREVQKDKPVIISMGASAASGAYWISSSANAIYASPVTATGSIGTFGMIVNFQKIALDHGVTSDGVKTAPYADIFNTLRPKTEKEMYILNKFSQRIYDLFIETVSQGRHMDKNTVENIAQGRIWSGIEAEKLGLIDQLGTLIDAIEAAAEIADLGSNWSIRECTPSSHWLSAIQGACTDDPLLIQIRAFLFSPISMILHKMGPIPFLYEAPISLRS